MGIRPRGTVLIDRKRMEPLSGRIISRLIRLIRSPDSYIIERSGLVMARMATLTH